MPVKHNFWIFLIVYGEKDASSSLETVRTEYEMTRVTAALLLPTKFSRRTGYSQYET